ncbi:protein-disulfide reductase DsbD family protein [Candidatus Chlamydia sanziniae]|uniref:Cytochrome c-type biogenesis protein DsbD n=1 Tax=Candidatus Chlamydia sanziniae TaxID=1806891 RepID=A0A1A9HV62_9CHLA|nr:thioredoxin family protein [Candidatus Chlamydia sanziniae]ANH78587.1 Cytochrome c-type biogenesis protein DsbD [Candidatus Chlamydia sanziniae]
MNKIKTHCQNVFIVLLLSLPVLCQSNSVVHARETMQVESSTEAEFLAENSHISGKNPFKVGIKITAPQGSHIYWKNPGELGSPLKISWMLPKGFVVQEEHWPAPKVFEAQGTTFFGYEDSTLIVADILPPKDLQLNQTIELKAHVEWLACGAQCFPGNADLQLFLSYIEEGVPSPDKSREFAQTLLSQPRILKKNQAVRIVREKEGELILNITTQIEKQGSKVWFVPDQAGSPFAYAETTMYPEHGGSAWKLKVKTPLDSWNQQKLEGVLLFTDNNGYPVESLMIRSSVTNRQITSAASGLWNGLTILVMAFLGGLLLNIMPCVLPLITLKVYALIKSAGEHRSSVIANSLGFTLGIVGCFWALAGVASLMKALGHHIGWGFQLQEPMFVAVLIVVFFLFALSSLGLFEMGTVFANLGGKLQTPERKVAENKIVSSFFNGVLATLVTTPCTGPFLGSVLGLVMSLSFVKQLLIFSLMGLGMASPYLVFSVFPKMLSILPKPGNWMSTFKQLTGFMLLGTVTWLVWIFGVETSTTAVVILLAGLWLTGLGAWILGRWGTPVSPKGHRVCASVIFFGFVAGALSVGFVASNYFVSKDTAIMSEEDSWQPFSLERLAELRRQGHPVFVNFTAKWCLTCQMNKPILYGNAVQQMFKDKGVVTLEADWTRKDPGITQELARLGRASVPSYVYYPADQATPIILPEKITQDFLQNLLASQIVS